MQFVQYGHGGKVRSVMTDVPSDGSRWDSTPAPVCVIYDRDGAQLVASRTASLGPSATIVTSVAAGVKTMSVVGAASLLFEVDERVWIGPNDSGEWEDQLIDKVGTNSISVADELAHSYESGTTIKSHRLFVIVEASLASGIWPFARAEWTYYVDSVSRLEVDQVHFSRYVPRHSVTPATIRGYAPSADRTLASTQSLRRFIDRVWQDQVLPDVFRQWNPGAIVDASALDQALIHRVLAAIYLESMDRDGYLAEIEEYKDAVSRGFQATVIDNDQDGAEEDGEGYFGSDIARVLRG